VDARLSRILRQKRVVLPKVRYLDLRSTNIRGRSVVIHRPPVGEMVKRHEVWSPNPPAVGNQQSKSTGLPLSCAWRTVQRQQVSRRRVDPRRSCHGEKWLSMKRGRGSLRARFDTRYQSSRNWYTRNWKTPESQAIAATRTGVALRPSRGAKPATWRNAKPLSSLRDNAIKTARSLFAASGGEAKDDRAVNLSVTIRAWTNRERLGLRRASVLAPHGHRSAPSNLRTVRVSRRARPRPAYCLAHGWNS
jgi:hypothetical protein